MIILFILGCCCGSFCYLVHLRMLRKEDFIFIKSHCDECFHPLHFYDLVPIISYVLLKGKCRYCGSKLSILYPLCELCLGIIFVYFYINDVAFVLYLMVIILFIIALNDFKTREVDVWLLALLFVLGLFYGERSIHGGLLLALPLFIIQILYDAIGGGDVILIFILGFILGMNKLIMLFYIAVYSGLAYCLIFKKRDIAFCPFFFLGFVFSCV